MFITPINSDYPIKQESFFQTTPKDPRIENIAANLSPGGENSYLQPYSKDVAFRIKARENFLLPPYKMGFRNLVTLIISPNMPLDEAEFLLHDIAVMTPEQRTKAFNLFSGAISLVIPQDNLHDLIEIIRLNHETKISDKAIRIKAWLFLAKNALTPALNWLFRSSREQPDSAKASGCPFQRLWTLDSLSEDPLVVKDVLKWHRFDKNVFKKNEAFFPSNSLLDKSVIGCEPEDTPRFRKIFTNLLLKKKAEERLMLIVQDHFDLLFEQKQSRREFHFIKQKGIPLYKVDLIEPLKKISACILDVIPILDFSKSSEGVVFDEKKILESQLYIELLNTGYTHEEIHGNFRVLANVTIGNGSIFLSELLRHLNAPYYPAAKDFLIKIKQNIQNELNKGCDIWGAIKKTQEIDMLILESLRKNPFLPSIES